MDMQQSSISPPDHLTKGAAWRANGSDISTPIKSSWQFNWPQGGALSCTKRQQLHMVGDFGHCTD